MPKVNKDHCLACALIDAYQKWCAVNGRATRPDKLRMTANFFSVVIDEELDIQIAGFSIPDRAKELLEESASSTKH